MFQVVNKENVNRPVVFYGEIIAMFWLKMSQTDTENDKNVKILQFSKILCVFFQIFDRLRQLERWKGSTRKQCVVQYAAKIYKRSFSNENGPELTSKKTKFFPTFLLHNIFAKLCQRSIDFVD